MRKYHVRFGGGLLEKCCRKTVTRQEPTLPLYDKEIARTAGLENGNGSETNSTRNGSPEPALSHTTSPVPASTNPSTAPAQPEALQYRDGTAVEMSNTAEVAAFNTFKTEHQGLAPATRDVLRAWSARSNDKK